MSKESKKGAKSVMSKETKKDGKTVGSKKSFETERPTVQSKETKTVMSKNTNNDKSKESIVVMPKMKSLDNAKPKMCKKVSRVWCFLQLFVHNAFLIMLTLID